eukprot:GHVS01048069.1.p1 GENE.GHVS01048069.1~~GHVS01048069.1.p1  ORF type:complete len:112 (+),score=11.14 GHVS01048069.1:247-582(+)
MSDVEPGLAEPRGSTDFCYDALDRILTGLGAVGRLVRSAFVSSSNCVRRTCYPLKESCVHRYDQWTGSWQTSGTRTAKAPTQENVAHFVTEQSREGSANSQAGTSDGSSTL